MEEASSVQQTKIPKPPTIPTTQNLSSAVAALCNKKRKLGTGFENVDLHNSNYFKIVSIVKELRPQFIEVLRARDFHNCKAAHEIRKELRIMIEFSRQVRSEAILVGKTKRPPDGQPLAGETGEESAEKHQSDKFPEKPHEEKVTAGKVTEKQPEETFFARKNMEKQPEEKLQGSYVVGGSPIGWNFVIFPSNAPAYYGRMKASFLERRRTAKELTDIGQLQQVKVGFTPHMCVMAHPKMRQYRFRSVDFIQEIDQIVGNDVADRDIAMASVDQCRLNINHSYVGTKDETQADPYEPNLNDMDENSIPPSGVIAPELRSPTPQSNVCPSQSNVGAQTSRRKSKNLQVDMVCSTLKDIASAVQTLVERIHTPQSMEDLFRRLNDHVSRVPGLSRRMQWKVIDELSADERKAHFFISLPDEEKMNWIDEFVQPFSNIPHAPYHSF